jgi:16S rRNA (guanine(1405)-N(7))-methyltransferase
MPPETQISRIITAVLSSKDYRFIAPELVQRLARQEAAKGRSEKETVKAVKNKLHQVGGAYQPGAMHYEAWLEELRQAAGRPAELRSVCRSIMQFHASTRERLPALEQFYPAVFAGLPPPRRVLDIACGLNPLALPWMDLPAETEYTAVDIYSDLINFLNGFFEIAGYRGHARLADVIESPPEIDVDLALVLKTIPCLEQIDRQAGKRLLEALTAQFLVVSFPARSLGGRSKGMVENYEAHFYELIQAKPWKARKIELASELVFVVEK